MRTIYALYRKTAFSDLDSKTDIDNASAIVFSASLDIRNHLRNIASECGFGAVCFKSEIICIDNFEALNPQIVIAETDSSENVWRFIFALHANKATTPLLVVSDLLKADSFLNKGFHVTVHVISMRQLRARQIEQVIQAAKRKRVGSKRNGLPLFVGHTDAINQIRSMLASVADTSDPVLITGEHGTGKELLARLIAGQKNGDNQLAKVNCAELGPGWRANVAPIQNISKGNDGRRVTVFLDHVDKLPTAYQAEFLSVIEAFNKSGNGSSGKRCNTIRIIAASDQNLEGLVQKRGFRKDLFYRLNVIPIAMPALRERKADIPVLMDYFVINTCTEKKKCVRIPSEKVRELCTHYNWPGNVEELQYQMNRIAEDGNELNLLRDTRMHQVRQTKKSMLNRLALEELPKSNEIKNYLPISKNMSLKSICDKFVSKTETRLIIKALESTSWNRKKAADLLNISYKSILNKMKVYDIL